LRLSQSCTDSDGNTFVVDEHAERFWLPQRHAAAIRAMLSRHNISLVGTHSTASPMSQDTYQGPCGKGSYQERLSRFSAGTDVLSRQSDGTTITHQYLREGITLKPANMDRMNGWAEILQRFGDPGAGIPPRLFIHQRCARLAKTLPSLQHDPNRPEDVLKIDADEEGILGGDAADALRYLVATKPRTITQRKLTGL